jgi:outer membrane lipoprotein-sorting protein
MKNLLFFGLMIVAMVLVQFAQAQTVEEIADKYAEARGGKDKLLAIKTIYMEGAGQMMGNEIAVKVIKEQGKLSRSEFETGAGNGFRIVTEKEGWTMFSMRSTTPSAMPAEAVAAQQTELDIAGPLVDFNAKGHKAVLSGKENSGSGTECFKIKLTTSAGRETNYWIDAKTYLLVQSSQKMTGRGGAETEAITLYSDYKAVDGVLFPHTVESKGQGPGGGSTTFDKVELNKPVDAKMYKPE